MVRKSNVRRVLVAAVLLALTASACSSSGKGTKASATLTVFSGTVEVQPGSGDFGIATDGQSLEEGYTIRTGSDGRAAITYFDGSITRLDSGTTFTITSLRMLENDGKIIEGEQSSGNSYSRVVSLTDSESRFDVVTPTATASVQGTIYAIFLNPDGSTTIAVIDGTVGVGETAVPTGYTVTIGADGVAGTPEPTPDGLIGSDWIVFNCEEDGGFVDENGVCHLGAPPTTTTTTAAPATTTSTTTTTTTTTTLPPTTTTTKPHTTTTTTSLPTTTTTEPPGPVVVNLSWQGAPDLDLHVVDPSGEEITYWHKTSASGGELVGDTVPGCDVEGSPTWNETISWATAPVGSYQALVVVYDDCGQQVEFTVTITVHGVVVGNFTQDDHFPVVFEVH